MEEEEEEEVCEELVMMNDGAGEVSEEDEQEVQVRFDFGSVFIYLIFDGIFIWKLKECN